MQLITDKTKPKNRLLWGIIILLIVMSVTAIAVFHGRDTGFVKISASGTTELYPLNSEKNISVNGVDVVIKNGEAYVKNSTCPDKLCVKAGKLSRCGTAACLPNGVVISLSGAAEKKLYSDTFIDTFDTVVTLYAYTDSREEFDTYFNAFHVRMKEFSKLFDRFNEYDGITNICTINTVGSGYVMPELEQGIEFALSAIENTHGKTDCTYGAVTSIWQEFIDERRNMPTDEELNLKKGRCGADKVRSEDCFVEIEEGAALDLGATAKGYSVQIASEELKEMGLKDFCINAGGNVTACGDNGKKDGWEIGIQDPLGVGCIETVNAKDCSVVTSGIYRRFREYEGQKYHHVIDTDTLYPAQRYASVSVICKNSAIGDMLSTALFCMDIDEGKAIADESSAYVIWITNDGEIIRYGTH